MTGAWTNAGPSSLPPPPPRPAADDLSRRPFWGPVDVVLAIPAVLVASIVGAGLGAAVSSLAGHDLGDNLELPAYGLFVAVLAQQLGQGLWPWIVSRRKGLGVVADWKLRFDFTLNRIWIPRDLSRGLGLAFLCLFGAFAATEAVSALVGLSDPGEASNTSIITDNESSAWVIGVIALVVIGAPLTEELLFRGLVLRVFEKSHGPVVAIAVSTVLFALPHWQPDKGWRENLVLLAAIAAIGLVLAIAVIRLGRLGPAIIAHFLFNAFGTAAALL